MKKEDIILNKEKKLYKPGLMRDVDKELVASLSDSEKIALTVEGYDRVASDWEKLGKTFGLN